MSVCRVLKCPKQFYRAFIFNHGLSSSRRYASSNNEAPVKFSQSPASGWKASLSRQGLNKPDVSAWFQPYVIIASVSVFLLYFCVIREESDIDEMLTVSLYDRIEGLEKFQLEASLEYNREHNLPTDSIVKRLKELEQEEIRLFGEKKDRYSNRY